MFKKIINFLKSINNDPAEAYLSRATDVADLERRINRINTGEAPFQHFASSLYK